MIDIMNMTCPHCKKEFAADIYVGEESHDYNATLVRKRTQHINWSEIKSEIENGYGNAILSVGDKLCFTLKDGRAASVSVIAINHYENNSVIFMFDNMLWEKEMNHRSTNHGGWHDSYMADFLDDEVYAVLPEELACVIKTRTIVQKLDNVEYKRESKLWLPSMTEVFGERTGYDECDFGDIQFPIFKKGINRIRARESGETYWYWLRAPHLDTSDDFWMVDYDGDSDWDYASDTNGVCPCFII